jgi:hypothetical protein
LRRNLYAKLVLRRRGEFYGGRQCWVRDSFADQRDKRFQEVPGQIFLFLHGAADGRIIGLGLQSDRRCRLLHAKPPRPVLLWFHAAACSAWIVLFAVQSALVRVRKVRVHRTLGWFGAALAATMFVSSFSVSVMMVRFDRTEL